MYHIRMLHSLMVHVYSCSEQFWVLVEDVDGETIVHHELFTLKVCALACGFV